MHDARGASTVGYDAVLVCAGRSCPGSREAVDLLGELVRCAPEAVLISSDCHRRCGEMAPGRPSVLLRRVDTELCPVSAGAALSLHGTLLDLRRDVARWLMSVG